MAEEFWTVDFDGIEPITGGGRLSSLIPNGEYPALITGAQRKQNDRAQVQYLIDFVVTAGDERGAVLYESYTMPKPGETESRNLVGAGRFLALCNALNNGVSLQNKKPKIRPSFFLDKPVLVTTRKKTIPANPERGWDEREVSQVISVRPASAPTTPPPSASTTAPATTPAPSPASPPPPVTEMSEEDAESIYA